MASCAPTPRRSATHASGFLDGGGAEPLRTHHKAVADVLTMLAAIDPDPHRTRLLLPDDLAALVHRIANRTGYAPGEVVTAALEWYLRQHEEPVSGRGA